MTALTPIVDYVDASKNLLMSMYQGKPNVEGLLTAFAGHQQRIEDALMQMRDGLTLAKAAGQALDGLGSLLGLERNGLTDDAYRVLLYAKAAENEGDGTLQTLLRVCLALFATDTLFAKTPASFARTGQSRGAWVVLMVGSPNIPSALYATVRQLVQKSLPAGVELAHLGTFNKAKAFAFAGSRGYVGGFGSIADSTVGAPIAGLLYNSTT